MQLQLVNIGELEHVPWTGRPTESMKKKMLENIKVNPSARLFDTAAL